MSYDITNIQYLPDIHITALQIKDHKCEICDKCFAQKSTLKSHIKTCKSNQKTSMVYEGEKSNKETINCPTVEIKSEPI